MQILGRQLDVLALAADDDTSANHLFGIGKLAERPVPTMTDMEKHRLECRSDPEFRYQPVRLNGVTKDQIDRRRSGEHSDRALGEWKNRTREWGWDQHAKQSV